MTDADNDALDAAIDVVAKRVLCTPPGRPEPGEMWEDYPEIGEHDWRAVVDRVAFLVSELNPADEAFRDAYRLLRDRSEAWEVGTRA